MTSGCPSQCAWCDAVCASAQDANLWDVSSAPTIVMTQRGARRAFQDMLCAAGVEVVQFDFLTPEAVAAYCQERGFLQVPLSHPSHVYVFAPPPIITQTTLLADREHYILRLRCGLLQMPFVYTLQVLLYSMYRSACARRCARCLR